MGSVGIGIGRPPANLKLRWHRGFPFSDYITVVKGNGQNKGIDPEVCPL
jgi:hypothetical protein